MKCPACGNENHEPEESIRELPTIKEQVIEVLDSIEKLYEQKDVTSGLSTGFKEFDRMTDGLHAAEVIVIGARPSMGRTALAMNIVEHIALQCDHAVGIFSLDMTSHQLVRRLLCSQARVNLGMVRDGFMAGRDFDNLTVAATKIAESKLVIDDTAGLSILELRAKARRMKAQQDIKLIVIDCLQLIRSTPDYSQNNPRSEISTGIKALAKELAIPIIVLAELNRNPEHNRGRPCLSDIRDSGRIEHYADVVGFLLREEFYADSDEESEEARGKATLIIAKQRNGPVGDVMLTFVPEFTRFEDRTKIEQTSL